MYCNHYPLCTWDIIRGQLVCLPGELTVILVLRMEGGANGFVNMVALKQPQAFKQGTLPRRVKELVTLQVFESLRV